MQPVSRPNALAQRDLLGIEGLSPDSVSAILDLSETYVALNRDAHKKTDVLRGRTLILLFFETSTRTRTSFELAGKRLGADVIVVRHPDAGAVRLLADHVNCAVINAGDGSHEHPTQALLDALTIRRHKGRLDGLRIAICGDIMHSRVARSNILLLTMMGSQVRLVAPPTLMPPAIERLGAEVFHDMRRGLEECDIIMMLRLQAERMQGTFVPSTREYFRYFGLDEDKLAIARPDALIMHPGPMNRGVEIDSRVADDITRSAILEQVELGLAVRQACLDLLGRDPGGA